MQFRDWAALLLSFCVIGIIATLAFSQFSSRLFSHVASERAMGGPRPQKGAILVETTPGHCRQFTFDNDSGRILPGPASCEQGTVDAQGHPVPAGTMSRIDAISKSFSRR
jgi:hypothetical protein